MHWRSGTDDVHSSQEMQKEGNEPMSAERPSPPSIGGIDTAGDLALNFFHIRNRISNARKNCQDC